MKRSVSHMVLRMRHRCFGMLTCCNMAQRCKELHNSPRCNKMRISRLEGTSSRRPVCISWKDAIRRMRLQMTRKPFVARQQDSLFARGNYSTRRLYGGDDCKKVSVIIVYNYITHSRITQFFDNSSDATQLG